MVENTLVILTILMIIGSVFSLHARDLLSAIVSFGVVGFGLVMAFLMLQAPDLAIVQIVVETISLIIMISVLIICTREDLAEKASVRIDGVSYVNTRSLVYISLAVVIAGFMLYYFWYAIQGLPVFGQHELKMAREYVDNGISGTGSVNLVTGIVFDFRGYDTLGEATILFTAVMGVLTLLRLKGKK